MFLPAFSFMWWCNMMHATCINMQLKFAYGFFAKITIEVPEAKSEAEKSLSKIINKIKLTCNYNYNVFI